MSRRNKYPSISPILRFYPGTKRLVVDASKKRRASVGDRPKAESCPYDLYLLAVSYLISRLAIALSSLRDASTVFIPVASSGSGMVDELTPAR